MCDEQIINAFADLLKEIPPPDTPAEIDAELRSVGLDPERVGREIQTLVDNASRRAHRAQRIAHLKRRTKWYIKQLLPLRYESCFREADKPILCVWRMWFGRCFNVRSFVLSSDEQ